MSSTLDNFSVSISSPRTKKLYWHTHLVNILPKKSIFFPGGQKNLKKIPNFFHSLKWKIVQNWICFGKSCQNLHFWGLKLPPSHIFHVNSNVVYTERWIPLKIHIMGTISNALIDFCDPFVGYCFTADK